MFEYLVSEKVAELVPYPPGKPLEELERELGISGAVKIASNENPLGPCPNSIKAVQEALPNLHRYPDGRGYYLKQTLAQRLNVEMEQIVLGNGSNEIIELAVRTFMRPGTKAVFSDPTFLVYSKVVQGADGTMERIPLKNFKHDLDGLAKAVDDNTRLIFLDNPNNPTGSLVPVDDLMGFLNDLPPTVVLIMDEAYVDFVRGADLLDPVEIINGTKPVVFLRTFSKVYGLAGLRVGYGLAHTEIVDYMDRVRQPFNVNTLGQIGAKAALEDDEFYEKTKQLTWDGLDWLGSELKKLGFESYSTHTNFIMIDLGRPTGEIAQKMLHEGVIIRALGSYGLDNMIRINSGLPEDNQRFINALKKVLGL